MNYIIDEFIRPENSKSVQVWPDLPPIRIIRDGKTLLVDTYWNERDGYFGIARELKFARGECI